VQFSIGQIRIVVHGLLDTTRKRLVEELMFIVPRVVDWQVEDTLRFDIANIIDNHSVMDEGFSFVYNAHNL
jgi:hypothetical protein